jgi:hypothetical protein
MITCINNQLNIFIMKKVILSISAMLFGTTMILAQGAPVSYTASYSIVTETGNDNSANIMQTGDKHVSEVTQDGHNYGFGGYKTKRLLPSQVRTKQ